MSSAHRPKRSRAVSSQGVHSIQGVKIRPTSKSLVGPAVPTDPHWLELSNLDRVMNPTYSNIIFFYRDVLSTERSFQDVTESMKESLARTLVPFYPLAGRLTLREDGVTDLHCNDQGAVFLEASVECDLDTLGGPKPMPEISGLAFIGATPEQSCVPDQLRTVAPLVIMVSKFNCGSVAVAVNWHHTVADGYSGCHFLQSWSEMARGKEISLAPNHDKSLLKPRSPPDASLITGSNYSTKSVISQKSIESPPTGYSTKGLISQKSIDSLPTPLPTTPALIKSFHIKKSTVLELKTKLTSEDADHRPFTSVESVSAHLWKQMTEARADMTEVDFGPSNSSTQFFMFVEGRKKLNLPMGYFGNVVCSACAVATEKDIRNKPVSYAGGLIRTAIKGVSAEYFRSLIDWVDIQGRKPSKSAHVNSVGKDVAATFWTLFGLYGIDFGFGKPILAARNSPARPFLDGIAVMPSIENEPGSRSGSMVALLNLHSDRMERISKLKSFQALFTSHPASLSDSNSIRCN